MTDPAGAAARGGNGIRPRRPIDWDRAAPRVVGAGVGLLSLVYYWRWGLDFATYWRAGRRFLAGAPLYPASDGLLIYRYSPGATVLFAPFAPLPLWLARALWYALLVAVVVWVARTLVARTPGPRAGLVVLLAFLGASRPFFEEIFCGHVNIVILGLLLAAMVAEDRGQQVRAGLLVAFAGGLKLGPFLLAADFLLRRRWRALLGVAAGAAALALLPIATYGLAGTVRVHEEWIQSLRTDSNMLILSYMNQGLVSMVARAGLPRWLGYAAAAAAIAWALASRFPEPRRSLLLFCLGTAAPVGWLWNFVCAVPALALVVRSGRWQARAVAAYGILTFIPIYDIVGPRIEQWVWRSSLPGIGLLAFFVLAARARPPDRGDPRRA